MSIDKIKAIQENAATRKLNILKGFKEFDELAKGHMDFNGGSKKSDLSQKQVTDKNGHQTTRWVKNGEDPKSEDDKDQEDMSNDEGEKSPQDWVTETSSEDLEKFLEEQFELGSEGDRDLIALAEQELENRGESLAEDEEEFLGEEGSENDSEGADFGDPESLSNYISENRDEIVAMMIEDPLLSASSAAKIHNAKGGSNEETHAKIDAAQAALDELKGHTGHPGSQTSNEGEKESDMYLAEADAWAAELSDPTEKSNGMTATEIDEAQADNYRKYESALKNEEGSSDVEEYEERNSDNLEKNDMKEDYDNLSDEEKQSVAENSKNRMADFEKFSQEENDNEGDDIGSQDAKDDEANEMAENSNTEEESGEGNELFESVQSWIGDDYKPDHIQSVIDALNEAEGVEAYMSYTREPTSQEDESAMLNEMATAASEDIQEGNWHSDMDRKDVQNVVWGLIQAHN